MKKLFALRTLFFVLITSLLASSGCIEITETIHFNQDMNSGKMSISYDMSKMQSMLSMLAGMDSTGTAKDPGAAMAKSFEEESDTLMGAAGISDVEFRSDTENLLFTINFKFDDINALNEALARIREGGQDYRAFEKKCKNKLSYSSGGSSPLGGDMAGDNSTEDGEEAQSLEEQMEENPFMKGMMEDLVYRQVVTFEGREVKKVKGDAKEFVVTEGNTMTMEVPIADMIENPKVLKYKLKAK